PPAREVLDGVLVIFGGALLLTPGFATDVAGLIFLVPPTRAALRRLLVRRFAQRMVLAGAGACAGRRAGARGFDVEGTATEVDRDPRRLP
ncbi:MAG: FxsA family protein, partial [Actinobacteria bacterium]|nr:FxsA family protein [Actinomycetota bacterium]